MIMSCVSGDKLPTLPTLPAVTQITIDSGARQFEKGATLILTATPRNAAGAAVNDAVTWLSSNTKVAVFQPGGALVGVDTGVTLVTASSLDNVISLPVAIHVVYDGPATLTRGNWIVPPTITPGAVASDSLRVLVTDPSGAPVAAAKVVFAVTQGGGTVSSATVLTGSTGTGIGVAATQLTVGATAGKNTVTATVVGTDGKPLAGVTNNPATFTVTSYQAFSVVAGSGQTGLLLSVLPIAPSVKLVDSLGKARQGVPVTFTAFGGGILAASVVSTGSDGVASPGSWTLGDVSGQQTVEARVDDAHQTIAATANGTAIHFNATTVASGALATCALGFGGVAYCWGTFPLNGLGVNVDTITPTPTQGSISFAALNGGFSHYCAVTQLGAGYCWGVDALVDTSGKIANVNAPTLIPSDLRWLEISPGGLTTPGTGFNCGITTTNDPYCWGANSSGQVGDNKALTRPTVPVLIPDTVAGGFKFSQISSGGAHACGIAFGGAAFCWGSNSDGQLGDGTRQARQSPTAVTGGLTFQSIGTGYAWSCGLTTTGQAYCWGQMPGAPTGTPDQLNPVGYPTSPTFTSLSVGAAHACALTGNGTAYCWGNNTGAQLGDSTVVTRTVPTPVAGGFRFSSISAGYFQTCGRTFVGDVLCWGLNSTGELGESPVASPGRLVPHYIVLGVTPP